MPTPIQGSASDTPARLSCHLTCDKRPLAPGKTRTNCRQVQQFGPEKTGGAAGRVADQAAGGPAAARLMQVQREAGGTFRIGRVWHGVTREREVRVKESSAAKYCLICRGEPEVDLDLPPEPGARWIANEPEPARPPNPHVTPEVISLVDQLIAGWTSPKAPGLEIEAGA
jgi:hypothetical protein